MAIAVGNHTVTASDAGSSVVINVPAGVANNDFMLMAINDTSATVPTLPAGWTSLQTGTTTAHSLLVCYRLASSEPTSYTVTITSGRSVGIIVAYTGVDTTTPIDATTPAATVGTTAITFPALTSVTANAWHIAVGSIGVASGVLNTTLSSANLDAIDQQGTNAAAASTNSVLGVGHRLTATAGSFTPTMTSSNASARSAAVTAALRPAATAAATRYRRIGKWR